MIEHSNRAFSFDEFVVDADRRLLLREGETVHLKGKAFDVLLTLIENRDKVVSKNELLDKVWENQFVEENNLTVHITALRKALGERRNEHRYIVTVPGKGYRFVGELRDPLEDQDLVVERRTFERIIVEEEFEEQSENGHQIESHIPQLVSALPAVRQGRRTSTVALIALSVVAVLAIAAGLAYRAGVGRTIFAAPAPFKEHRVTQLTTNGKVGKAALSPDGKLFAYVVDDLGQKSLWMGNVADGNHVQLRPAAEIRYINLVFSPDSTQLLYSARDDKSPKGALFRMPAFGGPPTKLLDGIGNFALSPEGGRIAVTRADGKSTAITILSLAGGEPKDVAAIEKDPFSPESLSWSPDGTRLAMGLSQNDRLYRQELGFVDIASGSITRVPLERYREITKTSWLADGSGLIITTIEETSHSSVPQYRLVHVSYPDGATSEITADRSNYGASWHNDAGATLSLDAESRSILAVEHRQLSNVWVAPADDLTAARQITFSSFGRYDGLWGLDWTPDGKIIYTTSDTRNQYLARMNADGTEQTQLTNPLPDAGHVDSVLTVSTDGRYVLFHSNRADREFDVYRADIDGSNVKRLTFGGKNFMPIPSPDGKWVYYKTWLDDVGRLCRVPIDGGEPEYITQHETSWMSFSPNGEYFAATYTTDRNRLAIFSSATHELLRQFDLPKTGTLYMGSRWTPDSKAVTYRDTAFGYWIQNIEGGDPVRLPGMPNERLYNFSWSRDGKWLAFVRGQEIRDVVLFRRGSE